MQGIFHGLKHLALIALILRALVPAGWMPDASGSGTVVICSVDAPLAKHSGQLPAKDAQSKECPFGAAPHFAFTPDVPVLVGPASHTAKAEADRVYATTIVARFTPQSPRAPPRA